MRLVIIMLVLFILPVAAAYRDPYMTIPEEVEVTAGETGQIEVILEHVQTTMWQVKVYVDTDQIESRFLQTLKISTDAENPVQFEEEIPAATQISATIDVEVAANAPAGQVKIPIIAAGNKGPCAKGCEPFFVQKSTTLVIKRQDPKLALLVPEAKFEVAQGETVTVEIQLKNYGAATTYIDELEAVSDKPLEQLMQDAPRQIEPGITESVILKIFTGDASPGSYLVHVKVVYRDRIQNKFTESKTIYLTILEKEESEPEPSSSPTHSPPPSSPVVEPGNPEEKYQYFLVGMFTGAVIFAAAVMGGLFLKKHRPTK
jgi:hypothetical protein